MQPRISQRPSLACRGVTVECTRRKRKCNKEIPCARCVRLGLHCDREIIYLRRHISQNGPEIAFLTSLREDLQNPSPSRIPGAVRKLTERIEALQSGRENSSPATDASQDSYGTPSQQPSEQAVSSIIPNSQAGSLADSAEQDSLLVTALEHIAWGRNYGNCYPHRGCACQYNRSWSELSSINSQSFQFARSSFASTVTLPDRELASVLVTFHTNHMAWHHNCLHSPTFVQQCNIFWETGECDQMQWIALYCSVLAASLFCLHHSSKYHAKYGYSPDAISYSAQSLFKTMLDVLYESNFLQEISLYSVQAIVISAEFAHNLGHSQLNATLFSAAIRIAECLGLHKIKNSKYDEVSHLQLSRDAWHEMLEREVGRRVWLQMIIQDHFAIPFTDSYGIYPAHYSTSVPKNADDSDLESMPSDIPTVSTYTRVLSSIADIMPELADGMGPLKARKPIHEQYEHILAMDQKMRQIVRTIPRFLLQPDPLLEARIPWLQIARQSLAITAAEKIIMVHRPFMFRSFQSSTYSPTRRTCVSASMTILREHRSITESGEVSLWTHTAFCITAALILCFELRCNQAEGRVGVLTEERMVYSNAVEQARQYLSGRTNDVLSQRGVLLINAIFPGMPGMSPDIGGSETESSAATISFSQIVSRFTFDWAILGLANEIRHDPAVPHVGVSPSFQTPESNAREDFSNNVAQGFEDFDAWFEHIFSSTSGASFS